MRMWLRLSLKKIHQYESPKIVPVLMKELNMKQDEAELLFKFIVNGSSSVNPQFVRVKRERVVSPATEDFAIYFGRFEM